MCIDTSITLRTWYSKTWQVTDFFPFLQTEKHSVNRCPLSNRKRIIFAKADCNSVEIDLIIIMPRKIMTYSQDLSVFRPGTHVWFVR